MAQSRAGTVQVIPDDPDGWFVFKSGMGEVSNHRTKQAAINAARRTARKGQLVVIRGADGSVLRQHRKR